MATEETTSVFSSSFIAESESYTDSYNMETVYLIETIITRFKDGVSYAGWISEFLVFVFFIFNLNKKSSIISSPYFRLLALGYFVDLLWILAFILQEYSNLKLKEFEYAKNLIQWHEFFFMGPWNVSLCLFRLTSICWGGKRHDRIWSARNFGILVAFLLVFPFFVQGYQFLNIHCRLDTFEPDCVQTMTDDFLITSISNAVFAGISLLIGIATKICYNLFITKHANNLSSTQLKVERNLLIQSIFSSSCYALCSLFMGFFPFFVERSADPDWYFGYVLDVFFSSFFFMLFHYSSYILLLIYSPALRNEMLKFYWLGWLIKRERSKVTIITEMHQSRRQNTLFVKVT